MINKMMRSSSTDASRCHPRVSTTPHKYMIIVGFSEGTFVISLNQVIHVSEGPEILTPFNTLELYVHANINTGEECEYDGEFPSMKTANSVGHWFHQIIHLVHQYTPLRDTKLFPQGIGVNHPKTHAFSHRFTRAEETTLEFLSTPSRSHQTSLIFRITIQFRNTHLPYSNSRRSVSV